MPTDKANLAAKQKMEGLRIGSEIGRAKAQMRDTKNAGDVRVLSELVKQKKEHEHQKDNTNNQPTKENE